MARSLDLAGGKGHIADCNALGSPGEEGTGELKIVIDLGIARGKDDPRGIVTIKAEVKESVAMNRHLMACFLLALGTVPWLAWSIPGAAPTAGKSALESEPKGWVDLLPGKDLQGWKRVPIAPDVKLNVKNPWSVDAGKRLLLCDGEGVKEMLLNNYVLGDGIFHVEWRFRKVPGKTIGYNSGIYVRASGDGKVWHQAQVALLEKPPLMADLFGETRVNGQIKHFLVEGTGHKRTHPPGEWNTYEITCKGKTITVWFNGAVVTTWNDCRVREGHVGVQAEGWYIEYKNLKVKGLKLMIGD